jgi:acyl carrier protein
MQSCVSRHERVRPFILRYVQKKAKLPQGIDLGCFDYIDAGYVDSMGIIKFVMDIESEFDIVITDEELNSYNFRTVDGVIALIEGKLLCQTLTPSR